MRFLSLGLLGSLLLGCSHDYVDIASSESRDTSPSAADVPQLARDEAAFAFDFYRAQVGADATSNVFYSPYSISVALAMTFAGANGNTGDEIASAMHFTLPPDRLHAAFDSVDLALGSRSNVHLSVANSIWGQRTLAFGKPFLDTLALSYGSEVRGVDFASSSTQATAAIDGWVADQTAGKITNLFAPGALDASTRVVLVNAIYFDATWDTKFDSGNTMSAPFTKADASIVNVPMMNLTNLTAPTAQTSAYTAIDIPYAGNQTSMLVVMPNGGQFSSIEAGLSSELFSSVVASLHPTSAVSLSLPKFTLKGSSVSLKSALATLGMVDAFDAQRADFSPMAADRGIFLRDVVHQAFVRVDEDGTEAAAATGSVGGVNAVEEPTNVIVNRPFFFFVRDVPTQTILFVGRVMDPSE